MTHLFAGSGVGSCDTLQVPFVGLTLSSFSEVSRTWLPPGSLSPAREHNFLFLAMLYLPNRRESRCVSNLDKHGPNSQCFSEDLLPH